MLNFITTNLSTMLVGGLLAVALLLAIVKMASDKKKGKGSCGSNCANCPGAGRCHMK